MNFEFHPEALAEFEEAADFYSACQPGLESRFITAVEHAILRACSSPAQFRLFDGNIRRILVHVFPYTVLYSQEDGFIYILAVMHCSREPGYWTKRKA